MPPPSQMKMQCSALPFGIATTRAAGSFANAEDAASAAVDRRKWRRFMVFED
jgi:hypothetical protein